MIPKEIVEIVSANARGGVKDTILVELQQEAEASSVPLPSLNARGRTEGNWVLSLNGKDLRPDSELSFDIVDEMLRDGMVIFVVLMKLAQIMTVFRSWRGWKITSPNKELAEVVEANLRHVLPQFMLNAGYRSLVDGSSFMELLWENKTKYQLGITKSAGSRSLWTVAQLPHMVDPRRINYIRRNSKTFEYEGFAQEPLYTRTKETEIFVPAAESLVMPYNIQFRNLFGKSFLEPIYPYWFWFAITLRSAVRSIERLGRSDILVRAPLTETLPDPNTAGATMRALDYMGNVASSLTFSNWAALPSDRDRETGELKYDLTYMKGEAHSEAIVAILQELAQLMLRAGLSADRALTQSSGGTGSFNIGQLHAEANSMHNQMVLTTWMWYINKYFTPWYSTYNFGPDGPPIWLEVRALDPEYKKLSQAIMSTMGNSPAGQEAWWDIDTRTLFELSEIPMLDPKEVQKRKEALQAEKLENQEQFMTQREQFGEQREGDSAQGEDPKETVAEAAYQAAIRILEGETDERIPIHLLQQEIDSALQLRGFVEGEHPRGKGGKFKSKPTSAKGSKKKRGGGDDPLEAITGRAKKRKGGFLRTTGKILAIGGAGFVAFGVLSAVVGGGSVSADGEQEGYQEADDPDDQNRANELSKQLDQLTQGAPKFGGVDEATQYYRGKIEAMGVNLPEGLKVVTGSLGGDEGGKYDPETNTLTIDSSINALIANGDPLAASVLAHELLHAGQEFQDQGYDMGQNVDWKDGVENYSQWLEGQNDLMTMMVVSDAYGRPITNEDSVNMSNQMNQLVADIKREKTGISTPPPQYDSVGYPMQARMWAGIAKANEQKTGQNAIGFTVASHDRGYQADTQLEILMDLFPSKMGSYKSSSLFGGTKHSYPPPSVIMGWLQSDYSVDPDQSFRDMLEEAAR